MTHQVQHPRSAALVDYPVVGDRLVAYHRVITRTTVDTTSHYPV